MQRMVNGEWVTFADRPNEYVSSKEVREASSIPESRALVLKRPDGVNQIIGSRDEFDFPVDAEIMDAPRMKRG